MVYLGAGSEHQISKRENLGEIITLDDRSQWKVSMFDKSKSIMWMMFDKVIVSSYGIKYKITNIKRNEIVEAEYIKQ
jgi:hypothetical protein